MRVHLNDISDIMVEKRAGLAAYYAGIPQPFRLIERLAASRPNHEIEAGMARIEEAVSFADDYSRTNPSCAEIDRCAAMAGFVLAAVNEIVPHVTFKIKYD